ncbi:hypothetical protein TWF694_008189 [Orbilia ellipsospora]|uniref:Uncharacterized protein n=1 Tax=Orbilia ellipsospora TaxID=2528407 RepID=A0AAV9XFZ6_9PEZI
MRGESERGSCQEVSEKRPLLLFLPSFLATSNSTSSTSSASTSIITQLSPSSLSLRSLLIRQYITSPISYNNQICIGELERSISRLSRTRSTAPSKVRRNAPQATTLSIASVTRTPINHQ